MGSPMQSFFHQSNVFVTGATGFLGKALVEKLLRDCPGIQKIYILVRPKRGLGVSERHRELLANQVFDRIKEECPSRLEKMVSIPGDVTQEALGLSEADRKMLTECHVVFHAAATVKFNEKLDDAVIMNTLGTRRVIDLVRTMPNLKILIHVSTAYANADRRHIPEKVLPAIYHPDWVIEQCEKHTNEELAAKLLGGHPNTYTLTKSLGENLVIQNAGNLPIAIVRPSIVTAAWKEPFPGWVDNMCGTTGIMIEMSRGTLRSIICNKNLCVDLIPVDLVVNATLTIAWQIGTAKAKKSLNPLVSHVPVYNVTSGGLNPIRWGRFSELILKYAVKNPTTYAMWYPGSVLHTIRPLHGFLDMLLHYLPNFMLDILLRLRGAKPIMMKIMYRVQAAVISGRFFALNEFEFDHDNLVSLRQSEEDSHRFPFDITNLDWDEYLGIYMLGIRQFVLKENPKTLPAARTRMKRFFWAHRILQVLSLLLFFKIITLR